MIIEFSFGTLQAKKDIEILTKAIIVLLKE